MVGAMVGGHYRVRALLGRTDRATVYVAGADGPGTPVVIKVLHAHRSRDGGAWRRLVHRARRAATVVHPGLAPVRGVGLLPDGRPWLATDYSAGAPLTLLLRGGRRLDLEVALGVLEQVSAVLAAAHTQGIVHGRVHAGNVLVERDEVWGPVARLLDLGGVELDPDLRGAHAPWCSPEWRAGARVGPAHDVYGLGVVVRRALRSDPPARLEEILRRCVLRDPARRYPTGVELHRDVCELRRSLEDSDPPSLEAACAARAPEPRWQVGHLVAPAAALLAALGAFLVGWAAVEGPAGPTELRAVPAVAVGEAPRAE